MSDNLKMTLELDGKSSGAHKAIGGVEQDLAQLADAGKAVAPAIDGIGAAAQRAEGKATPAHRKIADGVKSISEQLTEVKTLYAAWLTAQQAGAAVAAVAATADAYANLQARLKLVVGDGEALKSAFDGVQRVALATNSSLESTGTLFAKLVEAGRQLGVSQQDALALTESINQAVQLSGASAQASDAALTQLIQGLQGGVLRGDEFNSVMEQAPRLARAMADGLGVTTGELRKLAEAGQLTAETVIGALRGQAQAIEGEFAQLPATIGRAITNLETQWQSWIGSLDQSSGASATAASAIQLLADNMDFVAASLMNAGQAYLGWKAYNIAAEFFALKSAVEAVAVAKGADTAATVANTAATGANTTATLANNAAKVAGAAASDAAAASAGRLAGALSLVKGLSFAFLVTNLVDAGKWLGEAAAKAMGYGKAIEEAERKMRAEEAATKAMAAETAALAQQKKLAADAMFGLAEAGKAVIAKYDELIAKGKSTAEAVAEVGKALNVSDVSGIEQAGAALDALAVRGKLTAQQVQDAWAVALKGKDLQQFAVEAMVAFEGTERGVERLAAAMDARLTEAIRRTGKDIGELSNGVNSMAQRAINDFDVLVESLDALDKKGVDVGVTLAASLDQAVRAATTEAAVKAVIERWDTLGQQGIVTGQKLADGLGLAKKKLDELTPGINSLEEAYRKLGMKSQEEMKKTAEEFKRAYETMKLSGKATAEDLREAFKRYAEAALAANGGVANDALRVQAAMNGYRIEVDETGKAMLVAAGAASKMREEIGGSGAAAKRSADDLRDLADAADDAAAAQQRASDASYSYFDGGSREASVDSKDVLYKNGASIEEAKIAEKYFAELMQRETAASGGLRAESLDAALQKAAGDALKLARAEMRTGQEADLGNSFSEILAQKQATTPQTNSNSANDLAMAAAREAKAQPVVFNVNGKQTKINVASSSDVTALQSLLQQLEFDALRSN